MHEWSFCFVPAGAKMSILNFCWQFYLLWPCDGLATCPVYKVAFAWRKRKHNKREREHDKNKLHQHGWSAWHSASFSVTMCPNCHVSHPFSQLISQSSSFRGQVQSLMTLLTLQPLELPHRCCSGHQTWWTTSCACSMSCPCSSASVSSQVVGFQN